MMQTGEFPGTIALSITDFLVGLDILLSPNLMTVQQLVTLTIDADEASAPGTYVSTVTGESGELGANTTLSTTVVNRLFRDFLPRIQQP